MKNFDILEYDGMRWNIFLKKNQNRPETKKLVNTMKRSSPSWIVKHMVLIVILQSWDETLEKLSKILENTPCKNISLIILKGCW